MKFNDWYTIHNLITNHDDVYTRNIDDVIKYLSNKDLSQYTVQIVEYVPTYKELSAKEFIEINSQSSN